MRVSPLLLALTIPALAGCATPDRSGFPSLAIRPGERVSGTAEPDSAPPPPVPSVTSGSQLDRIRSAALAAHTLFEQRRPRAATLATGARGAAIASEAWSVAQVALADLDGARSAAMVALADVDSLYVLAEVAAAGVQTPELAEIVAVRDEITALVAQEDRTLETLRGGIAG